MSNFFVKTKTKTSTSKTKTKTLGLKTKTKTKTLFFVLEAPRDQDFGLEDYITGKSNGEMEECGHAAWIMAMLEPTV